VPEADCAAAGWTQNVASKMNRRLF